MGVATDPPIQLDAGSYTLPLFNRQEDREQRQGQPDVKPYPSFDSDRAFLYGPTEQHTTNLSGIAEAKRIAAHPDYSDDPLTALAEWTQEFMAVVNGAQGEGYTLVDGEKLRESNVCVASTGWTRTAGDVERVEWNMTYHIGTGVMVDRRVSPNTADPSGSWALDGLDLGTPVSYNEQKEMTMQITEMLLADSAEENLIQDNSGATRQIQLNGRKTGDQQERMEFEESVKDLIGQDTIVEYESAFPGHTLDVMVSDFSPQLNAEMTDWEEYQMTLVEGTQ